MVSLLFVSHPMGPTRLGAPGMQGASHSSLCPGAIRVPGAAYERIKIHSRAVFKRRTVLETCENANSRLCLFFLLLKKTIRCLISSSSATGFPKDVEKACETNKCKKLWGGEGLGRFCI